MSTNPYNPELSKIAIEIWSRTETNENGIFQVQKLVRSAIVDHNRAEDRRKTALMAREAMLEGHVCVTYVLKNL